VTYGQIIISERYLANDLKTIKPVDMGGALLSLSLSNLASR
jgi:hypothetical protein